MVLTGKCQRCLVLTQNLAVLRRPVESTAERRPLTHHLPNWPTSPPTPTPTLHLMCGKSTLAKNLATSHSALLLSEDHWLVTLYPGEIHSVADYLRCAQRLRGVLGPLVIDTLKVGVAVVLDFPANTVADRQWLRALADQAQSMQGIKTL